MWLDKVIREGFLKERVFLRKMINFFRKRIKDYILNWERKNKSIFSFILDYVLNKIVVFYIIRYYKTI